LPRTRRRAIMRHLIAGEQLMKQQPGSDNLRKITRFDYPVFSNGFSPEERAESASLSRKRYALKAFSYLYPVNPLAKTSERIEKRISSLRKLVGLPLHIPANSLEPVSKLHSAPREVPSKPERPE